MQQGNKKFYAVILVLLAALAGMVLWKSMAVRTERKDQENRREAWRLQVVETVRRTVTENTRQLLRLATIPMVWAIRKEMQKENFEQIDEYLVQFVKEPRIRQILVAKYDGTVVVATDKKLEGASFSSLYPGEFLQKNEMVITDDQKGNILIVIPIMGLNDKIGVFLMVYEPETISLDVLK